MRKQLIKKTTLVIASAAFVVTGGVGVVSTLGAYAVEGSANVQTLNGFECAGASVRVDEVGTRFQFNLSGEALSKKDCTAGVVYMPYDLYQGDLNAFAKGQEKSLTAEFDWENNAATEEDKTDLVGYTYLNAEAIPANMYNRTLVVRGYLQDGDTVYYTETIKTSMAYSAWQGTLSDALTAEQKESLKTYMGPYTLTYGTDETDKISDLYYGDSLPLPATVNGYAVDGWYWDEAHADVITSADYATGSMSVYYKLKEFTVSGTLSCADRVDMTEVRIAVDGVETDVTVDESGAYSLSVEPGTYKFTFSCPGYKACVLTQAVSEDLTLDAELTSDLYEVGNFGNITSSPNLVPEDDFDGQYTVEGKDYLLIMPNTATSDPFTYAVAVSNVTRTEAKTEIGISLTDGKYKLTASYRAKTDAAPTAFSLCITTAKGQSDHSVYLTEDNLGEEVTLKFVVTKESIDFYCGESKLIFSFMKDSFKSNVGNPAFTTNLLISNTNGVTDAYKTRISGFFAENASIAVGINSGLNIGSATATYRCNITKHYEVSGKISVAEGVDVTLTTLKVDGVDAPVSVNADGTYIAFVEEGKHELTFVNGSRATTEEITVSSGENVVNITLQDATWLVGNYGKINSNNTPAFNESGKYTISGANQLVVFPNTATSAPFTYEAVVSGVTRTEAKTEIGICLTDGNFKLAVGYRAKTDAAPTAFSLGISTTSAQSDHAVYLPQDDFGEEVTLKFVVTKESIQFYCGENKLIFSFMKDSYVSNIGKPAWTSNNLITNNNSVTDAYKKRISGFFAENAKIAVGINSGLSTGSATATYQCSITKN